MEDPRPPISDDDDDDFEDATEDVPIATSMDLDTAIEETKVILNLFLNNHFIEARSRAEPWSNESYYHALGYSTVMFVQAMMTFEMSDIEEAVKVTKRCVAVCNKFRRKGSMMNAFGKGKNYYNEYTREEIHAEMCYAECLLERALLTFIQDENLISFVKGGLKIKACYGAYRECVRILEKREWKEDEYKEHFEAGVCMGVGTFNLMISLLPARIMKLLEFVGFSGNKRRGLEYLEKGARMEGSIREPLNTLVLIAFHTILTYVLGNADGDIELSESLLRPSLKKYPKGAIFLLFAGRIELIKANVDKAIYYYEESVESQSEWKQFHHMCFWELMWSHCFQRDWLLAMKYAERLCKESRWSKATYTYQKAAFLLMCDDVTEETIEHVKYLMGEVPKLKQRVAGKSIPIEKFAVKKAERYFKQNHRLILPAYELIYVWNMFSIVGKKAELVEPILASVEKTLQDLLTNKPDYENFEDDHSLALLIKGVCLKYLGQTMQAEHCFNDVIKHEKQLKQDPYLVPYAMVELAFLNLSDGKLAEAKSQFHKAKTGYKGYSLESRLHFRIHAGDLKIKRLQGAANGESTEGTSNDGDEAVNTEDAMTEL